MKKAIILFILTVLFVQVQAQYNYSGQYFIHGQLTGVGEARTVYMSYVRNGTTVVDSALLNNGHFILKGTLAEPVEATLSLSLDSQVLPANKYDLFLEPVQIDFSAKESLTNAVVKGSLIQDDYLAYIASMTPLRRAVMPYHIKYNQAIKLMNRVDAQKAADKIDSISLIIAQTQKDFVTEHPKSPVALLALWNYYGLHTVGPKPFPSFYNLLDTAVQKLSIGVELKQRHLVMVDVAPGTRAKPFMLTDLNNKVIDLKNFKGKYVFVDFWASWCHNCIDELPFIKLAYEKYKDKGFSVLMISIDDAKDKEKWLAVIKKYNIQSLTNMIDKEKGTKNRVADSYHVVAIPRNFLIGPDGTIIANNLFFFQLENKLDEVFK